MVTLPPPDAEDLVVVVGPTASGKTALAVRLAEAWDGEVVGADSVQIYRRFDVGSGKPSVEERSRVPHHLVDVLEPFEPADAGRWAAMADRAIADVRRRGRVPVVCGGTFLWVRALLHGLAPAAAADPAIRARHGEEAARLGRAALHARLREVDPRTAARLAPGDFVRVSRALEVFELTGRPISEWHEAASHAGPRHRARFVGIRWAREALADRIAERTRRFLAAGWVDEVRALLAEGLGGARAMGSVGYRQVRDHVQGKIAVADLPDAIARATRVLGRRQRTWLRDQDVAWIDPGEAGVSAT